ncbi:NDP-sugar synthase [Pulveribacter sp.]|uniref:nucleotidyltransferase family protein n=1 Tax=Pulveribacter sp. TaxID=2678893 RepID=UPI003917EBD5
MLLAAGRGERMRPLTDTCPKPLLPVRGQPLLHWHLSALAAAGVRRAVINTAWLGAQIRQRFGESFLLLPPLGEDRDGGRLAQDAAADGRSAAGPHPSPPPKGEGAAPAPVWLLPPLGEGGDGGRLAEGARAEISSDFSHEPLSNKDTALSISYSNEANDFGHALETAGGIARALPLLDAPVFWLAAGDVFAPDFTFDAAAAQRFAASDALAHLWLVPNPAHHPRGDFGLSPDGRVLDLPEGDPRQRHTYSTIALLRAELFAPPWCDIAPGNPGGAAAPLAPLLRRALNAGRVTGALYTGRWVDVGTPERLAQLNGGA